MTSLLDALYPGDDVAILVANVLIQVSVVILLTMFVVHRFFRRSPAIAHTVWLSCLIFVGACPLVVFAANRAGLTELTLSWAREAVATSRASEAAPDLATNLRPAKEAHLFEDASAEERFEPFEDGRSEAGDVVMPDPSPTPLVTASPSSELSSFTWRNAISLAVAMWAAGVLLLSLRLLHGAYSTVRLRRTTTPLDCLAFADTLALVRQSTGMAKLPAILLSEQVNAPVVVAGIRPAVLFPASLPGSVSQDDLVHVLVHECAHVLRHDHLVGLIQRLVELIYWPHPLVHSMNRQLALYREEVCDNHVLASVGSAEYAETLLNLAKYSPGHVGVLHSIGMFGLHWRLEDRVRRLLDQGRDRDIRAGRRAHVALLAAGVASLVAATTLQVGVATGDGTGESLAAVPATADENEPSETAGAPPGKIGEFLDVDGNPWQPGYDVDGERLPHGAAARMGSRRLRHEGWNKRVWLLPDGQGLLSWWRGGDVRLWDIATGRQRQKLDLELERVADAILSRDGRSFIVLAQQHNVERRESTSELRLFDTSTWRSQSIITWTGTLSDQQRVALSADGKIAAASDGHGNLRCWDTLSGTELKSHATEQRRIESLAFSPDGSLLAFANRDTVTLWQWRSEEGPKPLEGPLDNSQVVVFSPDGRLLAIGGDEEFAAKIWDVATRRFLSGLKGKASSYYREGMAFSSDGKSLIVPANRLGTVEIFDIESGQLRQSLDAGSVNPRDVALSADGRLLATAGFEATIKLWDMPEGRCTTNRFVGHDEAPYEVTFTPDGRFLVTGSNDGTIRVWSADTGQQVRVLSGLYKVMALAVSHDGAKFVSCGLDNTVRLWDTESGRQIFRLPGHGELGGNRHYAVGFDRDGKHFLSFGLDLYLRVWSTETGKLVAEHAIRPSGLGLEATEDGAVRTMDASPTDPFGRSLMGVLEWTHFSTEGDRFFLCDKRTVYEFDTLSGREVRKLNSEVMMSDCWISQDGKTFATVERREPSRSEFLLKIHRERLGQEVRQIDLPGRVRALAISQDGSLIAGDMLDTERPPRRWISVWDVETAQEVAHIDGSYRQVVHNVTFSPDGTQLAAVQGDTTILVWDLEQFRVAPTKGE